MPQLATTANMDNGVDKSTIQQTQAAETEIGIYACSVRTITVYQQRIVAFLEVLTMIDQRNRNFDAIPGSDPQVFTAVIRRIKTGYFSLFQHAALAGIHIQFKQSIWRGHGGITVTQSRGFRFWIVGNPGHVGRIIKGNADDFPCLAVNLAQTG